MRQSLFWLWYSLGGRGAVRHCLKEMERSERMSRLVLDGLVRDRLAELVRHAAAHVPYYAKQIRSLGLPLTQDSIEDDLRKLPVLSKAILRGSFEELCSDVPGKDSYSNTSGGSTGEPARFRQDRSYQNWSFANKIRFFKWIGYVPGEPHMKIWGSPKDVHKAHSGLRSRIRAHVVNELVVDCHHVSNDTWPRCIEVIESFQPKIIEGYVDALVDLARFAAENSFRIRPPAGIVSSAGVLTSEGRALIEAAFRCPVLNRYGSREVGDVACSCRCGNALHVSELTHYVEILDDAGETCQPGEEGNIVVTLLTNFTMPLIRYRIEDRGVWATESCTCGRTTRTLSAVTGRTCDYLVASDGSRVNGTALTTFLYSVSGICKYQVRQSANGNVCLFVVPAANVDLRTLTAEGKLAASRIQQRLGQDATTHLVLVDHIPTSPSGKHRYIVRDGA